MKRLLILLILSLFGLTSMSCGDSESSSGEDALDVNADISGDTEPDVVEDVPGDEGDAADAADVSDDGDTQDDGDATELPDMTNPCGNGELDDGEACDDGNDTTGDGCSADCSMVEDGYACNDPGEACVELNVCGNGLLETDIGEACDDGNTGPDDGCSADCSEIEEGWLCPVPGERCARDTCGNGFVNPGEECDDGTNDGAYGGCNANCTLAPYCDDGTVQSEFGEECDNGTNDGGYGDCRPDCKLDRFCGDGVLTHQETCDDSNAVPGDGCDGSCQVEMGYICRDGGTNCVLDTCGNGTLEMGEVCDDGNKDAGDGCDPLCTAVDPGYDCSIPGQACFAAACGDGIVAGNEACDDGNAVAMDGCDNFCQLEPGFFCPMPGMACQPAVCGNGVIEGLEECDDGVMGGGTGCTGCTVDIGYQCPAPNMPCTTTTCGDSLIEGAEQCDDGNSMASDGCDADCQLETGFYCPMPGMMCTATTCGNGAVEGLEECDDGNLTAGDGCDPLCREESIWICQNGVCGPVCGDGITLAPFEECDDGNLSSGDGCSAVCTIENGFTCTDFSNQTPPQIEVPVVYRDFRGYNETGTGDGYPNGRGHPDFERYGCPNPTTGLVEQTLGPNGKPVFATTHGTGGCGFNNNSQQLTSAADFQQWYLNTAGVNQSLVTTLSLNQDTMLDPAGRTYVFDSGAGFFPLNGLLYGNAPNSNNFSFTTEFRAYFEYRGGELLDFRGDDDVWVFINGRLAVDLGGLHPASAGDVTLSSTVDMATGQIHDPRFDIWEGGIYEIALFHAERHTNQSNFKLTLAGFLNTGTSICEHICGDGVVRGIEECDDGNTMDGDGCSATCTIEPGYVCEGALSVCTKPDCGNSTVEFPESCDDGNTMSGDGCDMFCVLENCGDGNLDAGEVCDDGNTVDTDACTNRCRPAVCGDRSVQMGVEECDDGNMVDTDTCTNACTNATCGDAIVGPGETCDDGVNDGSYNSCTLDCQARTAFCGDGVLNPLNEECDDGINNGFYGTCNMDCTLAPYCGDGVVQPMHEECDDANLMFDDGCDGFCKVEVGWDCMGSPSICMFNPN